MSTQSASMRNASQAMVNASQATVNQATRRPEPVEFTEDSSSRSEVERVSVWWIPALMIGAWVEFAYVVPVVAHWFAQLT